MSSINRDNPNPPIAKESNDIERIRDKLEKRLEALDLAVTPEAFKKAITSNKDWLIRHSDERVSTSLADRNVVVYDKNIHPEKTQSKYVLGMREQFQQEASELPQLYGRVGKGVPPQA